jgi:hypothetical protein
VNFADINLCVASQRVFIIVVYFVIDSVRKLLLTLSYNKQSKSFFCLHVPCPKPLGYNGSGGEWSPPAASRRISSRFILVIHTRGKRRKLPK